MVRLTSTEGGMITKMDLVTLVLSFGSVGGFFFCRLLSTNISFENKDFSQMLFGR